MASLTIVYWRDIPAQVIAKAGRTTAKRVLPERFEKSIDQSASERMSLPVVLLMTGFIVFLGYPAVAQVINGL